MEGSSFCVKWSQKKLDQILVNTQNESKLFYFQLLLCALLLQFPELWTLKVIKHLVEGRNNGSALSLTKLIQDLIAEWWKHTSKTSRTNLKYATSASGCLTMFCDKEQPWPVVKCTAVSGYEDEYLRHSLFRRKSDRSRPAGLCRW